MTKSYTITMSSKGQFTLPVELRRYFNVTKPGDVLTIKMITGKKEATIQPLQSIQDIQDYFAKHRRPGIPPLLDPRAFYDKREPRV